MSVIDVGAGTEPDPRATVTADLHDLPDVDHQFDIREEWPLAEASIQGVVMSHVLEHVDDQVSVLREAARVLEDGGWLEVTVPIGDDAIADPDHDRVWSWATPEIYCHESRTRHWDADLPLVLEEREAGVWFFPPFRWASPLLQAFARRWPAEAVRRCSSGEITATYRRVER